MGSNESYSIRPAGRHVLTIGRDLIQDKYAAIVELVKNAYDADSTDVKISFRAEAGRHNFTIIIEDNGHGMSRNTVINQWIVPSTDDKLKRKTSPSGRIMQGRKGVGRYAASVLGEDLLLETTTVTEKTTLYVIWSEFEKARYLDEVKLLIDTEEPSSSPGTRLIVNGNREQLKEWNKKQINDLQFELKKLISPVKDILSTPDNVSKDPFTIHLTLDNFIEDEIYELDEVIEPYPIVKLFDYKISGMIAPDGKGTLEYCTQKARNTAPESIPFDFGKPTNCGELYLDIRVYDREKEAIESLIKRGLKDEAGQYVGKLQARQLLNKYNGIGVYRNGFRIRPLGDPEFDWLKLNNDRIQNPSLKIGSNQAIGYVLIQSEEQSGLIEKSARDGLQENLAYDDLKKITSSVISQLESRRFDFRKKTGLSRPALKVEQELHKLFEFENLRQGIRTKLDRQGIDKKTTDEILKIIDQTEVSKNRAAEDLRKAVAIYQGQATLGKIMNVILHEGRRPLNFFKNEISNLNHWFTEFKKKKDVETINKVIPIIEQFEKNTDILVDLFKRLDPLSAGRRSSPKPLRLKCTLENIFDIFKEEIHDGKIDLNITCDERFEITTWYQDLYTIFANIIDNSLYWMNYKKISNKKIDVKVVTENKKLLYIDYRDTGPGISSNFIESEVIFEPQFSTKENGKGLGLAIAGESASRIGLELKAFSSEEGVYFRLQPTTEED